MERPSPAHEHLSERVLRYDEPQLVSHDVCIGLGSGTNPVHRRNHQAIRCPPCCTGELLRYIPAVACEFTSLLPGTVVLAQLNQSTGPDAVETCFTKHSIGPLREIEHGCAGRMPRQYLVPCELGAVNSEFGLRSEQTVIAMLRFLRIENGAAGTGA